MKIENLKIGMIIKDYPTLCEILDIEAKSGGNARRLHKIELKRFFNWRNEGRKYIITEIYDIPKEKIDNRGKSEGSRNQNNTYMKHIDPILTNFFSKWQNGKTIYRTKNQLLINSNIVNLNYITILHNRTIFYDFLRETTDVSNPSALYFVLKQLNSIFAHSLPSSLERLRKRKIIDYKEGYLINSKLSETPFRFSTDKEINVIQKCEDKILEQMGIDRSQIYYNEKKFYKLVNELICTEIKDVIRTYKGYKITINNPESIEDIEKTINDLALTIKNKIVGKGKEKQKEVLKNSVTEKDGFGEPFLEEYEENTLKDSFLSDVNFLLDYIFDLNAKPLKLISEKQMHGIITKFIVDEGISFKDKLEGRNLITEVEKDTEVEKVWGFDVSNEMEYLEDDRNSQVEIHKDKKAYPWQRSEFVYEEGDDEELPF